MVRNASAMDWQGFKGFLREVLVEDWNEDARPILVCIAHCTGDVGRELLKGVKGSQPEVVFACFCFFWHRVIAGRVPANVRFCSTFEHEGGLSPALDAKPNSWMAA